MQPEPGIPHTRAIDRAARISDLRYDLRLCLPEARHAPIPGHVTIRFELSDASRPLVVDFAPAGGAGVSSLRVNAAVAPPPLVPTGHIIISEHLLRVGPNTIEAGFTAGDGPLNRRDTLLYSIFVPARAHEAFPCFDQPDLKARWTLTLDAPAQWQVVSNGPLAVADTDGDADGSRVVSRFAETKPLPTYLFAFAAGEFLVDDGVRDGRTMRLFHSGADAALVERNRDWLFDAHAAALRWLEDYTAIPYPFDTFDIVLVPAFQFSGMEHPGALFYNATSLLLGESSTRTQELARASLIAHETAHLWFGDLVTMRWFDDVWMKEVCANFMAAKIVHPQFPELDHDLRFLHAHYPGAYDVDRTEGTHPIRQPLDNLTDAGSLYGAIIYLKAPIVLRQLELRIGETALRDVFREYLRRHVFGNASWTDLVDLLSGSGLPDIRTWSHAWIDTPGRPHVEVDLAVNAGTVSRARLQRATESGPGAQRLDVAIGRSGTVEHASLWFTDRAELPALVGIEPPDYVLPNGRGLGYGRFQLDPRSRDWLLDHLCEVPDALTRASAWLTLWDAMLFGEVAPSRLLTTALDAVRAEDNALNLHRLLAGIERLFWLFTDTLNDAEACLRIEALLRARLAEQTHTGARAALFATFRAVASTPGAVSWLQALCSGASHIEGLRLGNTELVAVALELAVREARDLDALAQDLSPSLDTEPRGFLAFVAPALSADAATRQAFVSGLASPAARRPEPWVIEALRWLHHPLHESRSVQYLRPGLDLLLEIQRTGDIFLPKRWLDAMLSGHRSPAAAQVVHGFITDRPAQYPDALLRMLKASADPLFRAAAIL